MEVAPGHVPYFVMQNALSCVMCTHAVGLPMYNAHPYSSLKNMGKKCALYTAKYGSQCPQTLGKGSLAMETGLAGIRWAPDLLTVLRLSYPSL